MTWQVGCLEREVCHIDHIIYYYYKGCPLRGQHNLVVVDTLEVLEKLYAFGQRSFTVRPAKGLNTVTVSVEGLTLEQAIQLGSAAGTPEYRLKKALVVFTSWYF